MNISIVQDNCIIEEDEEFIIRLDSTDFSNFLQENRIKLNTTEGTVFIYDDDGNHICLLLANFFVEQCQWPLCTLLKWSTEWRKVLDI